MKTGLFLCRAECIGLKSVDVDAIAAQHGELASVKVFDNLHGKEAMETIVNEVRAKSLDGVVLAGCSPHYVRTTLSADRMIERLEEAGVNPNLIAFANLKEQCAMPHRDDMDAANRKAALMVEKALTRVRLAEPVRTTLVAPHRAVLVIGATPGGLAGAYGASRLGYRVFLLDKAEQISSANGGFDEMRSVLCDLELNPRVELISNADVDDVSGWCGDYTVHVAQNGQILSIAVGGILVAVTGDQNWLEELAPKLHVSVDENGSIATRNNTTMATRTGEDGIFAVSRDNGEGTLRSQVEAASTAITVLDGILSQSEIRHPMQVSEVDRVVCGACGTCVKTCAFHASSIDPNEKISVIDEHRCKACGNCVTACPAGARDLVTYPNSYIAEAIKIYSKYETNGLPKVLCILCDDSGYATADAAGLAGHGYPASILPLRVSCGARVDTQYVLEAFRYGFDGVMVTICREGHCPNIVGDIDMMRRVNLFRDVLRSRELDPERLRIIEVSRSQGERFAQEATQFVNELRAMEQ